MELSEILGRVQKAHRSGAGYVGLCPSHDDRAASLSLTTGNNGSVLLKCHAGCAVPSIVAALGLEMKDLMPAKEDRGGGALRRVATYPYHAADGTLVARKIRFVNDVGAKTFRWERPDPQDAERWVPGGNSEAPLYRLPELIAAPPGMLVVIVEGEKDVDTLAELGFIATTPPNGAGTKWRESDSPPFAGRRVCVVADDDEPGRQKAKWIAEALSGIAAAVGVVTMPNPGEIKGFDVTDFMRSGGTRDGLNRTLESFDTPRLPAEVVTHEIIVDRVMELWHLGGPVPGIYPGWRALANLFRPKVGQLAIVTGAPNAGKSTWLDDMIIRTSCVDDDGFGEACARWRWVIYSAEQYPVERHVSLLMQKLVQRPFSKGPTQRMCETEARNALDVLKDFISHVDPRFSNLHIDRILEVAAELNAQSKRHALLIDPFNLLAATSRGKGESEHDFINTFLAKLRQFAQAEQMAVFVVAHPTKLQREEGEDEYPVVRPWSISGSAHWFNHSDAILSVWRAMKDQDRVTSGEVEIHVPKVRFQPECGTVGMAKLYFDRVTTRYNETPRLQEIIERPYRLPFADREATA